MRIAGPWLALVAASWCAGLCSAQAPAVYQDLYSQLGGDIGDFQAAIAADWNGSTSPVTFAGQLTAANCNNGPGLLQPASFALVESEILLLKAIGAKAVSVEVSFPMLDPSFFAAIGQPGYESQFETFYANVASAIRSQGMKVIVESQSMIPSGLQSTWGAGLQDYYASLTTFQAYQAARARTVGIVAQTMQPDYFVLQEEPDTEANQSGQSAAGTVSGSTSMLDGSIVAARAANVSGMRIGAGIGSWLQAYQLFADSFTRQRCGQTVGGQAQPCIAQPLDFLDMHLFPIMEHTLTCSPPPSSKPCSAPNFWENALAIVGTANAGGVPMTISQAWLRKARDDEWPPVGGLGDVQEAREAYDFWEPLDLSFLHAVHDLAEYGRMLFVVPFNTQSYSGYLAWSGGSSGCSLATAPSCTALQGEGGGNTPAAVFSAVQRLGLTNLAAASYTVVGTGFHDLIAVDAGPPSDPADLAATRTTPTSITLSWHAAIDDVGVAGYHLWRDGTQLQDVFQSPLVDGGLSPTRAYGYQVQAFDLSGKVSDKVSVEESGPPTTHTIRRRVLHATALP